jgi:hypothetical protein
MVMVRIDPYQGRGGEMFGIDIIQQQNIIKASHPFKSCYFFGFTRKEGILLKPNAPKAVKPRFRHSTLNS